MIITRGETNQALLTGIQLYLNKYYETAIQILEDTADGQFFLGLSYIATEDY